MLSLAIHVEHEGGDITEKYMYITCVSGLWNFFLQWSLVNKLHRKTAFFRVTTLALTSKLVACNIDIIYELLRLTLYENLNSWIIHRYKWRKHPYTFLRYIWATKIIRGKNKHNLTTSRDVYTYTKYFLFFI